MRRTTLANPIIQAFPNAKHKPYYTLLFETLSDRTRWLLRNGFSFDPSELDTARWTCTHNGSDFSHSLEIVPFAAEHACNPRSLYLKVYLHAYDTKRKSQGSVEDHSPSSEVTQDIAPVEPLDLPYIRHTYP